MSGILRIATQEEESYPGERYDAVNFLLMPFDHEGSFPEDACRRAFHVEKWAKSQVRFPGERVFHELGITALDLLERGDLANARQCATELLSLTERPVLKALAYLTAHREGDDTTALAAVEQLEKHVDAAHGMQPEILLTEEIMEHFASKIKRAMEAQLRSMVWPARELRAQVR